MPFDLFAVVALEDFEGLVIIGLLGDLGDEFGVEDVVLFVEDEERSGEDAGEGAVLDENAVGFSKLFVTHHR